MAEVPEAQAFSESTIEAFLSLVDPDWNLRTATPAERGFCSVYEVSVATEAGRRNLFLKVSPDGQPWGIPAESRIQSVLYRQTSMPVPEVIGVVDDHEHLPSPGYLMTGLPGTEAPYEAVGRFDGAVLERLARELGSYLGELHSVPAVGRFGHVRHEGPDLGGDRPKGDPGTLAVETPRDRWPDYLRAIVEHELGRHADSRFADLTADLHRWLERGIDDLDGPFDPVLGRNDHGLHNLLVDPETGAITGVLDWGYTLAVPAAYDFEFAAYLFSGAFLADLPDVSDRRTLVREAMLTGYRSTAPGRVERVATPEPRYEMLAMVRIMNDFHHLGLPEGTSSIGENRIRADARALLD